MSLDFGKMNFSVSFNPTSAFPIDARSYFESYADAQAAAASAREVGSSDSVYYYGQTLVVVEGSHADFYIIQPNNTLSAISGAKSIPVNPKLFEVDAEGNLSLKGFDSAAIGSVFQVAEDGTLRWVESYSKEEVDRHIAAAVAGSAHLKRRIVSSVEEIEKYIAENNDGEQYVFMVPTGLQEDANKYNEYILVVFTDSEGIETRLIEKVGSWDVNLDNYATKEEVKDLSKLVNNKVDNVIGSRLMTNEEGNKLASLANIQIVDEHLSLNSGKLSLNNIPISKVTNLNDILNKGEATDGGYYLVTKTDKDKLNALVIGNNGLEISGTVNAHNVSQLGEWITAHANVLTGLSEENFTTGLKTKLINIQEGAEKNYIRSVSNEFTVSPEGQLNTNSIPMSKVINLQSALEEKADRDFVASLATDVDGLKSRLTWTTFM